MPVLPAGGGSILHRRRRSSDHANEPGQRAMQSSHITLQLSILLRDQRLQRRWHGPAAPFVRRSRAFRRLARRPVRLRRWIWRSRESSTARPSRSTLRTTGKPAAITWRTRSEVSINGVQTSNTPEGLRGATGRQKQARAVSRQRLRPGAGSSRRRQTTRSGCLRRSVMQTPSTLTVFFRADIEAMTIFHRTGKEPRWPDFLPSGKKGSRKGRFGSIRSGRNRLPGSGLSESKSRRSCRSGTSARSLESHPQSPLRLPSRPRVVAREGPEEVRAGNRGQVDPHLVRRRVDAAHANRRAASGRRVPEKAVSRRAWEQWIAPPSPVAVQQVQEVRTRPS